MPAMPRVFRRWLVNNIFAKLGLPPDDADHRRVLAVLRFLALG